MVQFNDTYMSLILNELSHSNLFEYIMVPHLHMGYSDLKKIVGDLGPLLLTWINFNPSTDKLLHPFVKCGMKLLLYG